MHRNEYTCPNPGNPTAHSALQYNTCTACGPQEIARQRRVGLAERKRVAEDKWRLQREGEELAPQAYRKEGSQQEAPLGAHQEAPLVVARLGSSQSVP